LFNSTVDPAAVVVVSEVDVVVVSSGEDVVVVVSVVDVVVVSGTEVVVVSAAVDEV
jgi:hypothetical protein